jgi:hypothetical protein
MIDHAFLKDSSTLEVPEATAEKANALCLHLEKIKTQEKALGKNGLPTNFKVTAKETTVIVSGDILFSLLIFAKHKILSKDKKVALSNEIARLEKSIQLEKKIAKPGFFAHKKINKDEIAKKEASLLKRRVETQKLIDKQELEDQEENKKGL